MKQYGFGTTTVGISCKKGIVLAADRRATLENIISNKNVEKIFFIDNNIALTTAGLVADAQYLSNLLKAEIKLLKFSGIKPSVKKVVTLASNILTSKRLFPYYVEFIIGGVDNSQPSLYILDLDGAHLKENFVASGSGSSLAYGILERDYKENMSISKAKKLAIDSISAALQRDIYSGEGISIAIITSEKVSYEVLKA